MSDQRPTPETDAASWVETNRANALTLASFSEKLERQRDEARELARELQSALTTTLASLIIRMGPEDADTVENAHQALGKAKQLLKP